MLFRILLTTSTIFQMMLKMMFYFCQFQLILFSFFQLGLF